MDDDTCRLLLSERSDVAGITAAYLENSSLHGLRFVGERNRSLCERIFWVIFFCVGLFLASYFILGIIDKWQNSPVYTTVESTSFHVSEIPFPAVTICSANKIKKDRLIKSIKGLEAVQQFQSKSTAFNTTMDFDSVVFMIESLLQFDAFNQSNPHWQWLAQNSPKIRSSDIIKLFRSSMPQCKEMLLHCTWLSESVDCLRLFRVMTTDDGFCCVFNAYNPVDLMKEINETNEALQYSPTNDSTNSTKNMDDFSFLDNTDYEVYDICDENEKNCNKTYGVGIDYYDYEDLIKEMAAKNTTTSTTKIPTTTTATANESPPSSLNESTTFPPPKGRKKRSIIPHLLLTAERGKNARLKRDAGSKIKLDPLPVPQFSIGAGKQLGLSILLDAETDKYFVTSDHFEGFKILIHHPEDFPLVRDRGFVVGSGQEAFVAVDGTTVYTTLDAKTIDSAKRRCLFQEEKMLDYYTNYTRSNCLQECSSKYIRSVCGCVPYYFPNNRFPVCGLGDLVCLKNASYILKSLTYSSSFNKAVIKVLQAKGIDCECPSACGETIYRSELSSAPFSNSQSMSKSQVIQEVIKSKGQNYSLETFRRETAYLHIFFKNEFIILYKRDQLYGIQDLVSNIGGLMGLCLGFSLLSLVELIYFFTLRWCCLLVCSRKNRKTGMIMDEEDLMKNGLQLGKSQLFDHIFSK